MTDEELGPCPLCGGEIYTYHSEDKGYTHIICRGKRECPIRGHTFDPQVWSTLCALAAQNHNYEKALERCCDTLSRIAFDCGAGWIATEAEKAIETCKEALKSPLVHR